MKKTNPLWLAFSILGVALVFTACQPLATSGATKPQSQKGTTSPQQLDYQQAEAIYDYVYPLVIMKISQDLMLSAPIRHGATPNHFLHFPQLAQPKHRAVVLANRNTLYSVGWVDLSKGPVLFDIPDMGERYFVMPLIDAWSNTFQSFGSRTTGQGAQKYMLVNDSWRGEDQAGYKTIVSPTNMVWITGRIQADSAADAMQAAKLQSQYGLTTLAEKKTGVDPFANYTPVYRMAQVRKPVPYSLKMSAEAYFDQFFAMWKNNPSPAADKEMLATLASIGIKPDADNSFASLDDATRETLLAAVKNKQANYLQAFYQGEAQSSAWTFNVERMGTWGTDYSRRAYWGMWGLGANLVEDAVYGVSQLDSKLQALNGANTYTLHFDASQLPPANAFWSLTSYNREGYLEPNSVDRYSLGSNNTLAYNSDGSVDLLLAAEKPAKSKSKPNKNWVPVPAGDFKVLLRLYWPRQEVLDGKWSIPSIEKN